MTVTLVFVCEEIRLRLPLDLRLQRRGDSADYSRLLLAVNATYHGPSVQ